MSFDELVKKKQELEALRQRNEELFSKSLKINNKIRAADDLPHQERELVVREHLNDMNKIDEEFTANEIKFREGLQSWREDLQRAQDEGTVVPEYFKEILLDVLEEYNPKFLDLRYSSIRMILQKAPIFLLILPNTKGNNSVRNLIVPEDGFDIYLTYVGDHLFGESKVNIGAKRLTFPPGQSRNPKAYEPIIDKVEEILIEAEAPEVKKATRAHYYMRKSSIKQ